MPFPAPGTPATASIGRIAPARAAAPAMPNIAVKKDRRSIVNLPTLHKLNEALACRMSRPARGEDRGFASRRSGLRILSAQEGTLLRRSTTCQPRTIPITRKVTAVAKIGASNQRAWPTLLSICFSESGRQTVVNREPFPSVRPMRSRTGLKSHFSSDRSPSGGTFSFGSSSVARQRWTILSC